MRSTQSALLLAAFAALAIPAAAAPPADQPSRAFTGTAVDPQGRPVAGAAVWLPPDDLSDEDYAGYLQTSPTAVTGADGRFTVMLPADWGVSPEVDVCAPGSLTGQIQHGATADEPVTVVLRPGARISGQVVDQAGAPVPGLDVATVRSGDTPSDLVMQSSPCSHEGIIASDRTDRDGRFTLEPLEPGWYTVRGGYVVESKPVRLASGQALGGMRLVIEHGAQISGRVTARDGSPVARATVAASGSWATTDAQGMYRIIGAATGSVSMQASDNRFGTVDREVEITAGENRVDLTLPDPEVIRGRVLLPDGGPAAGASVAVHSVRTATDDDGTFLLTLPNRGSEETMTVRAAGLPSAEVEVPADPAPLTVRLQRPGSIAGHVLGLRAPAEAQLTAESVLFTRDLVTVEAVADAEGRFRLPSLAPGTWLLFAVQGPRKTSTKVDVAPGQESNVEIIFAPLHRVSGRVVDGDGRPVACADLGLAPVHVPCLADGSFAAEVEDGTYNPSVSVDGRSRFHAPLTIDVAGAPVDRVEIHLFTEATVSGHILGLQPGEIPDFILAERIGTSEVQRASGTADQDGGYQLKILPGDWEIQAHWNRQTARTRLHIPEGAAQVDADLDFAAQ